MRNLNRLAICFGSSGRRPGIGASKLGQPFLCVLLLIIVAASPLAAQQLYVALDAPPYVDCPQAKYVLRITNNQGLPVRGLTAQNFHLTEQDQDRGVTVRELDASNDVVSVVIAIDLSESIDDNALEAEKDAAIRLVQLLSSNVQVAVTAFNDDVYRVSDFTNNRGALVAAINQIGPSDGYTVLYDAVGQAATSLSFRPGRRVAVILSDGQDTASTSYTEASAIALAASNRVNVFTIGHGDEVNNPAFAGVLQRIAGQTGGFFYLRPDPRDLVSLAELVAPQISTYYELTYNSSAGVGAVFVRLEINAPQGSFSDTFTAPACSSKISFTANPNPIPVPPGETLGESVLSWNVDETVYGPNLQVHLRALTYDGEIIGGIAWPRQGSTKVGSIPDNARIFLQAIGGNGRSDARFDYLASVLIRHRGDGQQASLTLSPSTIQVCDGSGLGVSSVSWDAPGVDKVELRVGANKALWTSGGSSGTATTGKWVGNGTLFHLVNAATGQVLATATASTTTDGCGGGDPGGGDPGGGDPGLASISASPSALCATASPKPAVTISWNAPGVDRVQILVGPNRSLWTGGGSSGSVQVPDWVSPGLTFALVNAATGGELDSVTIGQDPNCGGPVIDPGPGTGGGNASITAAPNPMCVSGSTPVTISWNAPGVDRIQILVGPQRSLWTNGGSSGNLQVPSWAHAGLTFVLVDTATGHDLASVTLRDTRVCTGTPSPAVMLSPQNNSTLGSSPVTFEWSTGSLVEEYYLRVGSSPGANDVYDRSLLLRLSTTFPVPTDGRTLYVTLRSRFDQQWMENRYVYKAPTAHQFQLKQHLITAEELSSGNGCPSPVPDHSFMTHETQATLYFFAADVEAGDVFEVRWFDRSGTRHRTRTWDPSPAGDHCYWDPLPISGNSAVTANPGQWTAEVFRNGSLLFREFLHFVTVPSARLTRVAAANCTSPPPHVPVIGANEPEAWAFYRISAGLEIGDRLHIQWINPSGAVQTESSWQPRQQAGSGCFISSIPIAGSDPSTMPGQWSYRILLDDYSLFGLPFEIR